MSSIREILLTWNVWDQSFYYAPNFEKVEGAYCCELVRPRTRLSVTTLRYGFEIS